MCDTWHVYVVLSSLCIKRIWLWVLVNCLTFECANNISLLYFLVVHNIIHYTFVQSHMIYCSSVWGMGSKNSLFSIFVSQKGTVRNMTFTKLYKKDKTTVYYLGHVLRINQAVYDFEKFLETSVMIIISLSLRTVLTNQNTEHSHMIWKSGGPVLANQLWKRC